MIDILYTKQFLKSAKKLPASPRKKLAYLLEILKKQPFFPRLHTKSLTGPLAGFYSFCLIGRRNQIRAIAIEI